DRFLISPRLGVRSPTKGCGKTLLLDVLDRVVARPLPTTNVTAAAIFRVIEAHRPTLLVDEADTFLRDNDELRGVLNSGHRKGGAVLRRHDPATGARDPRSSRMVMTMLDSLYWRATSVATPHLRMRREPWVTKAYEVAHLMQPATNGG